MYIQHIVVTVTSYSNSNNNNNNSVHLHAHELCYMHPLLVAITNNTNASGQLILVLADHDSLEMLQMLT